MFGEGYEIVETAKGSKFGNAADRFYVLYRSWRRRKKSRGKDRRGTERSRHPALRRIKNGRTPRRDPTEFYPRP